MADLKAHANSLLEAFNTADYDGVRRLMGGATYNELGTQRQMSGEDVIEAMQGWRTAMPDVIGTVTNTVETSDQVIQEVTWSGTHTGPMVTPDGEIPPSGKSQKTPGVMVLEYEGDQLKEWRNYFDLLTFLQQIGAA